MSGHQGTTMSRRFTVQEYHRMGEAGILCADERTELLDGELYAMPPIGSGHAGEVDRLAFWFNRRLGGSVIVRVQSPISLRPFSESEPQPDLALLRFREDFYSGAHPLPADVLPLIEVADTSVAYDRDVKLPLYASAGIAETWLFDLSARRLHVYRIPSPEGYREHRIYTPDDEVTPLAFADLSLPLADFLR
jgi:Uma2 family endonuclease